MINLYCVLRLDDFILSRTGCKWGNVRVRIRVRVRVRVRDSLRELKSLRNGALTDTGGSYFPIRGGVCCPSNLPQEEYGNDQDCSWVRGYGWGISWGTSVWKYEEIGRKGRETLTHASKNGQGLGPHWPNCISVVCPHLRADLGGNYCVATFEEAPEKFGNRVMDHLQRVCSSLLAKDSIQHLLMSASQRSHRHFSEGWPGIVA